MSKAATLNQANACYTTSESLRSSRFLQVTKLSIIFNSYTLGKNYVNSETSERESLPERN